MLVRPESDTDLPIPDAEGLRDMRLLLLEEGHCFRDQALSFCSMSSLRPRESFDASSLSTLVQMVSSGIGVTLLPEMAVPVETHGTRVCVSHFAEPVPKRAIGLVWRKTSPIQDRLEEVAQMIEGIGPS